MDWRTVEVPTLCEEFHEQKFSRSKEQVIYGIIMIVLGLYTTFYMANIKLY